MTKKDYIMSIFDTAWTGHKAHFVSPEGDYGKAPYSELCMHTRHAGHTIRRYATFKSKRGVTWAHVQTDLGVVDGLPHEVLPCSLANEVTA